MPIKHRLFLAMYSFKIKKRNTSNKDVIEINDFLSSSYPDVNAKFEKGFVQDIIELFDKKLFNNKTDTMGGILERNCYNTSDRTFDIMINGGTKGLRKYLIDQNGEKRDISDNDIVGLKFFTRVWLPAQTNSGYLFIQRYQNASIKPLFDELIKEVLAKHNFILAGSRTVKTTTKKRQKEFMNRAVAKEISVIVNGSPHDTGGPNTATATIALKKLNINENSIGKKLVDKHLRKVGIKIDGDYNYKTKYQSEVNGYKEEKTVKEDDTFTLIPNTPIPAECIDENNHPDFKKMQLFVSNEMNQLLNEAKQR